MSPAKVVFCTQHKCSQHFHEAITNCCLPYYWNTTDILYSHKFEKIDRRQFSRQCSKHSANVSTCYDESPNQAGFVECLLWLSLYRDLWAAVDKRCVAVVQCCQGNNSNAKMQIIVVVPQNLNDFLLTVEQNCSTSSILTPHEEPARTLIITTTPSGLPSSVWYN